MSQLLHAGDVPCILQKICSVVKLKWINLGKRESEKHHDTSTRLNSHFVIQGKLFLEITRKIAGNAGVANDRRADTNVIQHVVKSGPDQDQGQSRG